MKRLLNVAFIIHPIPFGMNAQTITVETENYNSF
jgi:hypothetical protein